MDHPTITIELIGSCTARHVESGTTVDFTNHKNTKSALPPLCRELLNHGHDGQSRVHVVRRVFGREGYMPIFKRDRRLDVWAGLDAVESETRSVQIVKHRPFPATEKATDKRTAPQMTGCSLESKRLSVSLCAAQSSKVGEAA